MSEITSPLSPISYTSKDFRDIYPELLDIVRKLTYKWDPSISNESDPGVILLKLNAIIGDKNNYNIDKNVLEVFPETLTQEVSARNMYHQLAYEMPWYQSATTQLTFKWTGRDLVIGEQVTIPKYTMVSDPDSKTIYTITQNVYFTYDNLTTSVDAIQGIITDVSINGSTEIHLTNLDHNNRLYLDDYSVAENGIFITNIGSNTLWERKPNLAVEPTGNTYYEFGVDGRTNLCYIEFPDDIEALIKDGLTVKYLLSDGTEGNVAAKFITTFYDDVSVTLGEDKITLGSDNCVIYNPSAANNGSDPQGISDAYKSFKRVSGTFDTIVALRDYINAIYNSGMVSNDVVSDRNHDIQSSYTIITDSAAAGVSVNKVHKTNDEPEMSAFDLRLYLLNNPGNVGTLTEYESTFNMIPSADTQTQKIKLYLEQTKVILHDFKDIIADLPCLFRIAYPLRLKIVPQYKLTDMQQNDVRKNILLALYKALNSKQLEFGEEPSYDEIYDVVANSDERIKLAIVDDFNYTTFATYWTGTEFKNIPLCNYENDPYVIYVDKVYNEAKADFEFAVKNTDIPEQLYYICKSATTGNDIYKYNLNTKQFELYSQLVNDFRKQIIAKSVLAGVTPLYNQDVVFNYTIDQQVVSQPDHVDRVSTDLVISPFGFENVENKTPKKLGTETSATYKLKDNESLQFLAPSFITKRNYSNYVAYQFIKKNPTETNQYLGISYSSYETRQDKDTLKLYAFTETFEYVQINDKLNKPYYTPIFIKGTYYDVNGNILNTEPVDWGKGNYYRDSKHTQKIVFEGSDQVTFLTAWQNNVLGVYYLGNLYVIQANTDYRLEPGDSIILFYTEEQDSRAPYVYECYKVVNELTPIEERPIIRASFTLNGRELSQNMINPLALGDTGYIPYNSSSDSAFQKVYEMFALYSLSGSQTIDIRGLNEKKIVRTENYYYFITNDIDIENDNQIYRMVLLPYGKQKVVGETNIQDYQYTLKTDEYFIYTNKDKTEFEILGPGTLIRLSIPDTTEKSYILTVDLIDYNLIANQGIAAFEDACKLFKWDALLREQQIYNFTAGDNVRIDILDSYKASHDVYPSFGTSYETPIKDFNISYSTNDTTYTSLPGISITDDEAVWKGTAILNIDSSFNDPQVINNTQEKDSNGTLLTRQSVQQITIDGKKYPEDGDLTNPLYALMYFLTNVSVTRTGGDNVDVTYLKPSGERSNLELLIYYLNSAFTTEPFINYINKICMKTTEEGVHTVEGIKLQSDYKYIIGIRNDATDVTFGLNIHNKGQTTNLVELLNGENTLNENNNLDSSHTWYFKLEGNNLETLELTITTKGTDSNGLLMFDNLLKYVDNPIFEENYNISVGDIIKEIKVYDTEGIFKYNVQVDEATKIDDPVIGKSFFSEKHIFNKYAISEALLKPPKEKSSPNIISIINNR